MTMLYEKISNANLIEPGQTIQRRGWRGWVRYLVRKVNSESQTVDVNRITKFECETWISFSKIVDEFYVHCP